MKVYYSVKHLGAKVRRYEGRFVANWASHHSFARGTYLIELFQVPFEDRHLVCIVALFPRRGFMSSGWRSRYHRGDCFLLFPSAWARFKRESDFITDYEEP